MATRRPKLKPKQMVLVDWLDANSHYGWSSEGEHDVEPSLCHSLGFVLMDAPDYIRLAFGFSDQGNIQDSLSIPRGCILAVKPLREED